MNEPHLLGLLHHLAERHGAVVRVEDVRQRAGQDALDVLNLVARHGQALHRVEDGQTRAHRGLREKVRVAVAADLADALVVFDVA